jgi:hypothetical protein
VASTFTVTFQGVSGIGAGRRYVYRVVADSHEHAAAKALAVAELPLARIDRSGTNIDPQPISVTEHKEGPS